MTEYQKINLVVAGIAAFSTFLAVLCVLFKDTFLSWRKRPRFKCDIKMELPYVTKTVTKIKIRAATEVYKTT